MRGYRSTRVADRLFCYRVIHMRIVMAASIFPPEIGGPATYAAGLKDALERMGHTVDLQVFSSIKYPSGIRHIVYTRRLLRATEGADLLIAFDTMTTGLPAAIVRHVRGTRTIARVGGDFIWERYVERTHDLMPLTRFYELREKWKGSERTLARITAFVLQSVDVAFSSEWQKQIWTQAYALDEERTQVIENAIPPKITGEEATRKNFMHFGRQIWLKNSVAFREAFEKVKEKHPDIVLEEGAIPHEELLERMKKAYAVVLPSVSDVTPNIIIDSIRCGKPFLLTRHSGYAERFKDMGVIVDPLDEQSMAEGIERLLDAENYARMRAAIAAFAEVRTYEDIATEFLAIVHTV